MANFRDTGRGLVIADVLFSIPVIWCFFAVGEFVWLLTQSSLPETTLKTSNGLQFESPTDADNYRLAIRIAFAVLGLAISQVSFFISRTRPPAAPAPLWRFHLITLICGVVCAGGLLWLIVHPNKIFGEFSGWPYAYRFSDGEKVTWSTVNLCWDVALCATLIALLMLIIEYIMARPVLNSLAEQKAT